MKFNNVILEVTVPLGSVLPPADFAHVRGTEAFPRGWVYLSLLLGMLYRSGTTGKAIQSFLPVPCLNGWSERSRLIKWELWEDLMAVLKIIGWLWGRLFQGSLIWWDQDWEPWCQVHLGHLVKAWHARKPSLQSSMVMAASCSGEPMGSPSVQHLR